MPADLIRFHTAQDSHDAYADALSELRSGRKTSHWMWFVFPQLAGLGRSATARYFAMGSVQEAVAYLADPVLGPRLREAAEVAAAAPASSVQALLGGIDAIKLRSSMTLFAVAAPEEPVFRRVLDRWFEGVMDDATLALLGQSTAPDTLPAER